jgi:hypothetical protein
MTPTAINYLVEALNEERLSDKATRTNVVPSRIMEDAQPEDTTKRLNEDMRHKIMVGKPAEPKRRSLLIKMH